MIKGCGSSLPIYALALLFATLFCYPVSSSGIQPPADRAELHTAEQLPLHTEFYFAESLSKLLEKNDVKEKHSYRNQSLINYIASLATLHCTIRIIHCKTAGYYTEVFPLFLLLRKLRL